MNENVNLNSQQVFETKIIQTKILLYARDQNWLFYHSYCENIHLTVTNIKERDKYYIFIFSYGVYILPSRNIFYFKSKTLKSDVNILIGKVWTASDWLSSILTSNFCDKIKRNSSNLYSRISTIVWLNHVSFNEAIGEKARRELENKAAFLNAASNKTAAVQPLASHLTNYQYKTSKICYMKDTVKTNSQTTLS